LSPPTGNRVFCLSPERGARTVALAHNPPVSPPIAGPRRHLPPQRRSHRGSPATTSTTVSGGGGSGGGEADSRPAPQNATGGGGASSASGAPAANGDASAPSALLFLPLLPTAARNLKVGRFALHPSVSISPCLDIMQA
jgi:hypothetical protein